MRDTVEACRTSIEHHRGVIPDDVKRDRQGERISTGIVASTVHQGECTPTVKQPALDEP